MPSETKTPLYPLVWSKDVGKIADWAVEALGLEEVWRAGEGDSVEHAELAWNGGRISLNWDREPYQEMGPAGIALVLGTAAEVDHCHERANAAGARIVQGPEETRVAYSFTALDPDGNQWWVHAETGFLDELRKARKAN